MPPKVTISMFCIKFKMFSTSPRKARYIATKKDCFGTQE
jgi:hypothetical protein